MCFRNITELGKDGSKWRQAMRCNLYITRDICLFSDILHRIYGMFEFKDRLNFICFLKDNKIKVKHIYRKFRLFRALLKFAGIFIRGQEPGAGDQKPEMEIKKSL
jgi:hypothetical protein